MYPLNYVDFDDNGPKEIRCMKCGTLIAKRVFGKMKKNAAFAQVRLMAKHKKPGDGEYTPTFFDVMVCKDDAREKLDGLKILDVIRNGWEKEQRAMGWTDEQMEAYRMQYADIIVEA